MQWRRPAQPQDARVATDLGLALREAIQFWEPRRFLYNGVLVLVSITWLFIIGGGMLIAAPLLAIPALFVLVVLANCFYCAAYLPDLALQLAGFERAARLSRWPLFVCGCLFASLLALAVLAGPMF